MWVCELRLLRGTPALGWVLLSQGFLGSENGCVQGRAAGAEPGSFQYVNSGTTFPVGLPRGWTTVGKLSAWWLKDSCPGQGWWYWEGTSSVTLTISLCGHDSALDPQSCTLRHFLPYSPPRLLHLSKLISGGGPERVRASKGHTTGREEEKPSTG